MKSDVKLLKVGKSTYRDPKCQTFGPVSCCGGKPDHDYCDYHHGDCDEDDDDYCDYYEDDGFLFVGKKNLIMIIVIIMLMIVMRMMIGFLLWRKTSGASSIL